MKTTSFSHKELEKFIHGRRTCSSLGRMIVHSRHGTSGALAEVHV